MDREICADHYRDAPQEHDLDHLLVAALPLLKTGFQRC
jgi:hypothetical protein